MRRERAPEDIPALLAGMAAGADSIDDIDVLRHGAMSTIFGGIRAPSTLGSHLRSWTWGDVAQLEKAGREFLAELSRRAPLLPGAGVLAFVDIDSMQKRVYGHAKQGAMFGHTKIQGKSVLVRGLNALAATISTPIAAPVIAATRLPDRLQAVEHVAELAIATPDSGWLTDSAWEILLNPSERAGLMRKVREELVPM